MRDKSSFTIEFQPRGLRMSFSEPVNAMDAARQAGINLNAICGGEGLCGKCMIQLDVKTSKNKPSKTEKKLLSSDQLHQGYRLACLTTLDHDTKVLIPAESIIEDQVLQIEGGSAKIAAHPAVRCIVLQLEKPHLEDLASDLSRIKTALPDQKVTLNADVLRVIPDILRRSGWKVNLWLRENEVFHAAPACDKEAIGLAVDVGSTKIACYLVDLVGGKTLTAKGIPNPQISFGEDIMARLAYAMEEKGKRENLFHQTIDAINTAAVDMCNRVKRIPEDIADICLVGNTAMHHFFLNLPIGSLAVSPFVPVTTDSHYPPASSLGLSAMQGASVYTPPVIAGFVGSDHLAFLLAAGFGAGSRTRLGIDIGTNTEIALQAKGRIVSVSTASGPAFEGAHITHGMRAAPGAIEHVQIKENGYIQIEVIGNQAPIGICGSGILDAVAGMRAREILNHRGRIRKNVPGTVLSSGGKPEVILADQNKRIALSQLDVDQILLAKGAIRAGIDILLDYLQIDPLDIEEVIIAGAFGSYMLPEHAMGIGMLPTVPLDRVKAVGNAAGSGARMMLASTLAREKAEQLAQKIEYLELTVYPEFPLFYANGIRA